MNDALKVVGVMAAAFVGALVGVLILRWAFGDYAIRCTEILGRCQ
jgi:hypothetical protein